MDRMLLVTNKRTDETLEITLEEFKGQFSKEIDAARDAFEKMQLNKKPYLALIGKPDKARVESDFYFDLQWNFNNLSNSAWYIAKFLK